MEFTIDGNAFLHVATRQAIQKFRTSYKSELEAVNNENTPLTDFMKKEFTQSVLSYMNSFISQFYHNISHVHLVLDNISWRAEYVNKFFELNPDHNPFVYKGKRKQDKDYLLLNKFFKYFHEDVVPLLRTVPGFFVYSTIGAEGDDIIAYLVDKFPNEDMAIWTGDQDIGQTTIDTNRKVFLIGPRHISTKKRRISVNETTKSMNFNYNAQLQASIDNVLGSPFYEKINLLPGKDTITKIVTRDQSDNIGSIYVRYNKKSNPINITPKRGEKFLQPIFDKYADSIILQKIDSLDADFLNEIIEILIKEFKIPTEPEEQYQKTIDKIKKNYERNVKLVRLSKSHIPEILFIMIERVFDFYYKPIQFDYAAFAANIEERRTY